MSAPALSRQGDQGFRQRKGRPKRQLRSGLFLSTSNCPAMIKEQLTVTTTFPLWGSAPSRAVSLAAHNSDRFEASVRDILSAASVSLAINAGPPEPQGARRGAI